MTYARQDIQDYFSTLIAAGAVGYAKSYYWDFIVNNTLHPNPADFNVGPNTAARIRYELIRLSSTINNR